ncbi:hypothetical protein ABIA39_000271 [Nocardia sp. GAS34]|uniref:type IV secretory system conjugative DNA transfer family protein n=1 Tax=unclassified Nocardia TaxID=2637762 RepID=UPI003D1B343E
MTPTARHTQNTPSPGTGGGVIGHLLTHPAFPLAHLLGFVEQHAIGLAAALVATVTGLYAVTEQVRHGREHRWAVGAREVEILVPPHVAPDSAQVLWEHLHGAIARRWWQRWWSGQHALGFEYRIAPGDGAAIRVWVPSGVPPDLVENAITVAWRGARTRTRPATSPLPAAPPGQRNLIAAGQLRLADHDRFPISTDGPGDTVAALIGAASGMEPGTSVCVQVLARPAPTRRRTRHTRSGGGPAAAALLAFLGALVREFVGLFVPGPAHSASTTARAGTRYRSGDRQVSLEQSARDHAAAAKARGPAWATIVRYAVTAPVPVDADRDHRARVQAMVRGRALSVASYLSGASGFNHYRRRRILGAAEALTARRLRRGDLLSSPELAVLAHLPADTAIAEIHRAGARALAPTEALSAGGPGTKPLGHADAMRERTVALRVADARHHVHVIGPTGCGKSTLLARMILADAEAQRGLVLIDPKGDLVTDIVARLPHDAGDRVVLFDADSQARPPCINPLDLTSFGGDLDQVVGNIGSVFARIYHQYWGPRTDDLFRNALTTVLAQPRRPTTGAQPRPATLMDVARLLTEDAFRARRVADVEDPILHGFWNSFEALGETGRAQLTAPLMNKLRQLLMRPFVKATLAAGPATVDVRARLDGGGIVLARLPKGRLGEDTTRLLGALLVARTWQAATSRTDIPESQRRDAALYLDEFHNFLHTKTPIDEMLDEARAMRLSMVLAHQNLGQLNPVLREAISANARTKIYFATSPEDSRDLARHTTPHLSEHDLAHLDAYHAAARLIVNGQNTTPCTLATDPLPPPIPGRARTIRAAARTHTTPAARKHLPPVPTPGLRTPTPQIPHRDPRRS